MEGLAETDPSGGLTPDAAVPPATNPGELAPLAHSAASTAEIRDLASPVEMELEDGETDILVGC